MLVTSAGNAFSLNVGGSLASMVTVANLKHPENAPLSMIVTEAGMVMLCKLPQSRNDCTMVVSPLGRFISVKLLQFANAECSMVSNLLPSPKVTVAKLLQKLNASNSMVVTELGIVMLVKLLHS